FQDLAFNGQHSRNESLRSCSKATTLSIVFPSEEFSRTNSLHPGRYRNLTVHASYVLAVIRGVPKDEINANLIMILLPHHRTPIQRSLDTSGFHAANQPPIAGRWMHQEQT